MARILLLGAGGQLGADLAAKLGSRHLATRTREELDITRVVAVEQALAEVGPAIVINATAADRVDAIETDPRETADAFAVNAVAVHHLARVAARHHARLVHFSTDYVFGAGPPGPYSEDDPPAPLNTYGTSKLAGEHLVRITDPRHLVIRSSGLYGGKGSRQKGGNFVLTMLRRAQEGRPIRVVDDQVCSPTYTADLAGAVAQLLALDPPGGLYHLTNTGSCSWFEFARAIFQIGGLEPDLARTTSAAFGAAVRRPTNSVLRNTRAQELGVKALRPWTEALGAYLAARAHLQPLTGGA